MTRKSLRALAVMAVCVCLLVCAGCAKQQPHEHTWDEGAVTAEAGCVQDGVRTYTCTECGETKTGPIPASGHSYGTDWSGDEDSHWQECTVCGETVEKAAHTWDEGAVTKEPTAEAEGEKTFTCTVCGRTRTEPVPMPEETEIASFTGDFSGTAEGSWVYGCTRDFNFDNNTFTFSPLPTFNGEAWTDGDGIEIKADWLRNETGGAPAVLRYLSEVGGLVRIHVEFRGSDPVTRMTARLHIAGADGAVKSCEFIAAGAEAQDWTYDYAAQVEAGDAVSLIFFNEGDKGYFHGNLSMTVLVQNHTHEPVEAEAKAPTCTEAGWTAGKICAICGQVFEGHEELPAAGHAYSSYWSVGASSHWHACTVCGAATGEAAHTWDGGKVTKEPTMEDDGVRTYTCTVCGGTRTEAIPNLSQTEVANFTKDFSGAQTGKWRYGYTNDFNFDNNTFTFKPLPTFNGDAWTDGDGIEIKADWLRNETGGAPAVVRYLSEVNGPVQLHVEFRGSDPVTRMTARLHIAKADGTVKACEFIGAGIQAQNWTYDCTAQVEQGDAVSLIFFNEGDRGYFHGSFSMTVTASKHVHTPTAVEAKAPTCTEAGWTAGKVCAVCGEVLEGHETLPATGHRYAAEWSHDGDGHYHVCTVCGVRTQAEAHTWDEGKVTTEPTMEAEGEKTFTCTVCGAVRTESIPKLTETVVADFTKDFGGSQEGSWRYGYTNDFHFDSNTFTFHPLPTFNGDAWTDGDGIEIKSDWLRDETAGTQAVVRYVSEASGKLKFAIAFNGSDDVTRMAARLHIAGADGTVKTCEFIDAGTQAKDWTYEYAAQVEQGDTVSLIFFPEGSAGYFHGKFSMTVIAEDHIHNLVWRCDGAGHWQECTVCGFRSETTQEHQWGKAECVDEKQHQQTCLAEGCGEKRLEDHTLETVVTKEPTLTESGEATDTCTQCGYSAKRELPPRKFADFQEDFTAAAQGTEPGQWKYGYATEYNFDNNNFKFNALTSNGESWTGMDGIEIKRDWLLTENGSGANAAVGYIVPAGKTQLEVQVTFTHVNEETRLSARLLVVGSDGSTKSAEFIPDGINAPSWSVNREITVADGDTVYVILFPEGGAGWRQGKLQILIGDAADAGQASSAGVSLHPVRVLNIPRKKMVL